MPAACWPASAGGSTATGRPCARGKVGRFAAGGRLGGLIFTPPPQHPPTTKQQIPPPADWAPASGASSSQALWRHRAHGLSWLSGPGVSSHASAAPGWRPRGAAWRWPQPPPAPGSGLVLAVAGAYLVGPAVVAAVRGRPWRVAARDAIGSPSACGPVAVVGGLQLALSPATPWRFGQFDVHAGVVASKDRLRGGRRLEHAAAVGGRRLDPEPVARAAGLLPVSDLRLRRRRGGVAAGRIRRAGRLSLAVLASSADGLVLVRLVGRLVLRLPPDRRHHAAAGAAAGPGDRLALRPQGQASAWPRRCWAGR